MPRPIAANKTFTVWAPGFLSWEYLYGLLLLKPSKSLRWWVRHEPSGTEFRLSAEEHARLDELAENFGKLLGSTRQEASDVLLQQIDLFWRERRRR